MVSIQDQALAAAREVWPGLAWTADRFGAVAAEVIVRKGDIGDLLWWACPVKSPFHHSYGTTALAACQVARASMERDYAWLGAALGKE